MSDCDSTVTGWEHPPRCDPTACILDVMGRKLTNLERYITSMLEEPAHGNLFLQINWDSGGHKYRRWMVPSNASTIFVSLVGGGGGGGLGVNGVPSFVGGGGGGGGAVLKFPVAVSPKSIVNITLPTGGLPQTTTGQSTDGGDAIVRFDDGQVIGRGGGGASGSTPGLGGVAVSTMLDGNDGAPGLVFNPSDVIPPSGNGGSSFFMDGGVGCDVVSIQREPRALNNINQFVGIGVDMAPKDREAGQRGVDGVDGELGAGGGGAPQGGRAGRGGDGFVLLEW